MKALIIDDEDDVRQVVRLSLGRVGGMDVVDAHSGAAGVALALETRPDFILLDLMMPEMDGVETFSRLRGDERTASIPVIFLTAKALPSEIERLRNLGALDVVVKPFNPMTLADQLRAILRGAA
ncbi:MAG: response regulator [Thermoanaerobaculia bacterium]